MAAPGCVSYLLAPDCVSCLCHATYCVDIIYIYNIARAEEEVPESTSSGSSTLCTPSCFCFCRLCRFVCNHLICGVMRTRKSDGPKKIDRAGIVNWFWTNQIEKIEFDTHVRLLANKVLVLKSTVPVRNGIVVRTAFLFCDWWDS